MKVSTLKELVKAIPDDMNDAVVYVSTDEEGNGFNPLYSVDMTSVADYGDGELSFYNPDYHGEDDEDFVSAVVLWP